MSAYSDLKDLMISSGLLGSYQFRSVWLESSESAGEAGQRFVIMRQNGSPSDKYVRRAEFQVQVLGRVNDISIATLDSDAEALIEYLLQQTVQGCMIAPNILADKAGVYFTDSGRPFYLFNVEVLSATS